MRINFFKLLLLITVLVLSSGDILAQFNWTKYPGNPVMSGSGNGTWDKHIFFPMVIHNADSSRYEMWYTGSYGPGVSGWLPYSIGLAYSPDGITWTKYAGNPVLSGTVGSWDESAIQPGWVAREGGQYKMWYYGSGLANNISKLGYATSPNGINWTKNPNPILSAGTAAWEAGGVFSPSILKNLGSYTMFYTGVDAAGSVCRVGRATSLDGINWQKDTINNPVLSVGAPGQWDDGWIAVGRNCLKLDNKIYLWYTGASSTTGRRVGIATSTNDGVTWTKYSGNPVLNLGSAGSWDANYVQAGTVLLEGNTFRMWYDGSREPTPTNLWRIGVATSPLPLPPGTYTIGSGGYFSSIQSAFDKLSTDGVAGPVTLELIDDLYTAPTNQNGFFLNGIIPGAGPNSRVTIKPADNKNVIIEGNGGTVLSFLNTSYVTVDGVGLTGATTLTIHALFNAQFQWNSGVDFFINSDHNVIQDVNVISEDYTRDGESIGFLTQSGFTATADSNLIQNNFIKKAPIAIFVGSLDPSVNANGNIIRGNLVGSETDSLIAWGIQSQYTQNTIVENNIVQNVRYLNNYFSVGINSYVGDGDIIRNNVVHNIYSSGGIYGGIGIMLSGDPGVIGSNSLVYNNMVYDIRSSSNQSGSIVAGIQVWYQNNPKIFYNSVYLSGNGNGANPDGSAALYISGEVTNLYAKNNIFVNNRDESPYCASSIYDYTAANLTSDYNDLYYEPNQYNCLVRAGGTDYLTLAEWQATGQDLNSVTEMPNFISPYLHIAENEETLLESRGIPIAGIDVDFDGQTRHAATPDIGADEFNGIAVGVEDEETLPTEYALEQNYPNPFNPSTTFRYSIPQTSKVVIKVFDILGNAIETLVSEEKSVGTYELTWDAASMPSGVYFYQLKAGEYTAVKKMILLK
jgi:hypothetical protein